MFSSNTSPGRKTSSSGLPSGVGVGSTGPDSEDGASPHDDVLLASKTEWSSSASNTFESSPSWWTVLLSSSVAVSGIGASSDSAADDSASPLGNPSLCKETRLLDVFVDLHSICASENRILSFRLRLRGLIVATCSSCARINGRQKKSNYKRTRYSSLSSA
ncbi:uncharacterized protein LOC132942369 [Metopolophium dirhodum]|uniref:uncharacterized protein LOC132942369 n=1 Tax=Metopolophium dirhodum TaxID=44670 RepID=UPI00298FBCF7|nr:uncharacterized protein LOC132942369 [Metopolophium dirhodum]